VTLNGTKKKVSLLRVK
jgi:hypothetical protein